MNGELENAINSATDLPTIPVVATKVLQLMGEVSCNSEALARVIAADPAVAARVLKTSNSAFYGCQRKITTLSEAIVMLGFNTLKSMVVSASVKQVYKPYGLTEKLLWEHSFAAGMAAKIIASNTVIDKEEAFLAGLFHDIGKIIMNHLSNEKFQSAMQYSYNENISYVEAEKHIFPFSHDEVGAYVIKKWNFPDTLTKVVHQHHRFEFSDSEDEYIVYLTAVVNLADLFCAKLGIGHRAPNDELDLEKCPSAQICGLKNDRLNTLLAEFNESFAADRTLIMS